MRDAIDQAPRRPLPTVSWFSGHQHFPDAFYEFNRSGRMNWDITTDLLALQGSVGELKNVAVVLVPSCAKTPAPRGSPGMAYGP